MIRWGSITLSHSFPKPINTNLWASRGQEIQKRMVKEHSYALDLKITPDQAAKTMAAAAERQQESSQQAAQEMMRKVFETGIGFLERYKKQTIQFVSQLPPPFVSHLWTF